MVTVCLVSKIHDSATKRHTQAETEKSSKTMLTIEME